MTESVGPEIEFVDSSNYKGPERREAIVVTQCKCHPKHTRILDDHDKELNGLKEDLAHRRELLDQRIERIVNNMGEDIKIVDRGKVPNRLFYIFISAYSALFILGIITVYTGMHQNSLNFMQGINALQKETTESFSEIEKQVTTLQYESAAHGRTMDKMEKSFEQVKSHILNEYKRKGS
jgi:chaperonin cofactor prefoldin